MMIPNSMTCPDINKSSLLADTALVLALTNKVALGSHYNDVKLIFTVLFSLHQLTDFCFTDPKQCKERWCQRRLLGQGKYDWCRPWR